MNNKKPQKTIVSVLNPNKANMPTCIKLNTCPERNKLP